jgi:glutathione S-transferase
VREQVAALDEQLGDRPYLFGDRFTAADLSAACLLAPALVVSRSEGYAAVLPELASLPGEVADVVAELRQTRIGRHCLRMFAEERRSPA